MKNKTISHCLHCFCMTHTVKGKCGKCLEAKKIFYEMLIVAKDLAGSISSGCDCIKCKNYTKELLKRFDVAAEKVRGAK